LKVNTSELADRQVELTVEVPSDQVQIALQKAARRLGKQIKIPGFRPGKAPYGVVASKLGEDVLLEEALDDIGQDVYRQALDEAKLEPFAAGILQDIVSQQPLVLRYTVPLAPTIELGDYRSLRIPLEETEVEDAAVEETLEELRQGQALIEPVERPLQMGDVAVVDVEGQLLDADDGAEARLLDEKNASILVEEATDWPIPGIAERLIGLSTGDEIDFDYQFPEDYANENLQAKDARFKLRCLDVKSRILPEWSDNLAKNLGDHDDLLALRISVREQLQEQQERRNRQEYRDQVMDAMLESAEIVYPPSLLDREIEDMIHDLGHRLERQGLSLEQYLELEGKDQDQLREEIKPEAEARLLRGFILGQLVEEEGLEIAETEVDEALDQMVEPLGEQAGQLRSQLDTPAYRRQVELDLLTDKAVEHLAAIARGDDPPGAEASEEAELESKVESTNVQPDTESVEEVEQDL
jgi:trigger factor